MKYKNVFSLMQETTERNSEKTSLGIKTNYGWSELTYKGLGYLSRRLACYFIYDMKLEKGEKVAILSESKPEYGACFFAGVLAGLTSVPLDNKLTIYELESILSNCEPSVLLASGANYEKALTLKSKISSIKQVIFMDRISNTKEFQDLYSIPENYEGKWRRRSLDSTALIIYTSGTTGSPKGVEITYKNILSQVRDLQLVLNEMIPKGKQMRILSILPINHLFELTVGFFTFLDQGFSIYYAKSLKPKDIAEVMQEKGVTFMISVPAFLKLLKSTIESEVSKRNAFDKLVFKIKYKIAKFSPFFFRRFLFRGVRKYFGLDFFGCISGGAPLDYKVGKFFETIGIRIYQGYGLSEASPVVSMNRGKYQDLKSVGTLLDSFEAKIDESTGELILKGPSVMKGYYKRPDLTQDVITEDGWLHTGDIAKIDKRGLVYITGRIKNMIVLSGGKKVFPEEVEAVLEKNPNFAEICVTGASKSGGEKDGAEEIVLVVVPKKEYAENFADKKALEGAVANEVKTMSKRLAHYKRPVKIIVTETPLPRTATNKVKRKEVKSMVMSDSVK